MKKPQSKQKKKQQKPTNRKNSASTLLTIANSTFKTSVKEFRKTGIKLEIGDYVIARMKGYSPWPAKISSFTKNRCRALCYFYGSHNNGSVDINEIVPFSNGYDSIRLLMMRNLKDFQKGIRELEIVHGIPENLSSLRETISIQ